MDFGEALRILKCNRRVARAGWNGKGMWLVFVRGSRITVTEGRPLAALFPIGASVEYHAHIDMKAADGSVFTWTPNQLDMMAEDWTEVVS